MDIIEHKIKYWTFIYHSKTLDIDLMATVKTEGQFEIISVKRKWNNDWVEIASKPKQIIVPEIIKEKIKRIPENI